MSAELGKHYQVEFLGLPGAGKSTLAVYVIDRLKNDGYICHDFNQIFKGKNIPNKWSSALLYFLKNTNLILNLLLYSLLSSPANPTIIKYNMGRLVELLKHIIVLEIKCKKFTQPSLIILDQGVMQCIWSITSKGGKVRKDILKKCMTIKKSIFPDFIIFIDIEPKTAVQRISKRNSKCIFDQQAPFQSLELFSRQEVNYFAILEIIKEIKNPCILTLYGSDAIKDNIDSISEFINKEILKEC